MLHIGTFAVYPLAEVFFGNASIHFVIVSAVFTVLTLIMHFGGMFKAVDGRKKKYPGIFYYAMALLTISVLSYFFPTLENCFGVGFIALAFGDGFATLLGIKFGKHVIYREKTLEGFFSCIVFTAIPLIVYSEICGGFLSISHIMLLAVLAAIVELIDFGLDNLALPITTFFAAYLVNVVNNATVSLAIFVTVFVVAFFSRLISYYGALLASLIGSMFYFYGGSRGIVFVITCYAVMISVSFVGKILKNDLSSVVKKTRSKDLVEIFVNGAGALLSLILYACTEFYGFYVMALISLSAGFVDSLASDIGTLSRRKPYDIFHRRTVTKGMSGGITMLGTLASLVGAVIFATAITFICGLPHYAIILISAVSYAGCITDTVIGALFQAKYRCSVCGSNTEREEHCGAPTQLVSGLAFINNDTVNFISNTIVFLLSFSVFFVV
jgi:uncharacterized protein (TIGR00297 family)